MLLHRPGSRFRSATDDADIHASDFAVILQERKERAGPSSPSPTLRACQRPGGGIGIGLSRPTLPAAIDAEGSSPSPTGRLGTPKPGARASDVSLQRYFSDPPWGNAIQPFVAQPNSKVLPERRRIASGKPYRVSCCRVVAILEFSVGNARDDDFAQKK